ncbi:hypothetical protein VTN96DRAFT_1890 [Rasamsonia emersonii]|uniref:Uncharacterized protein n=1 Tax=Rasamsonia emersonii (strain ATCC 16479 / CBS 393.64 / IMI 116815) TaxID=1408163 RepID=A0A0F4YTX9_RASE3|nr:hypothetical protein T310_4672 [Rasamsonia emersonii CBS 393.64]KKA21296.1 hypothetical protein T310_4672 [Rasamsonia emersonii CBS 393.64]
MAKATKRSGKDKSSYSSSSEKPLTPFVKAPSILEPFLEPLSTQEIYLIHIDTHPPDFKKQLFIVPVLLNTAILLLVAYRVYKGAFVYPALVATALGFTTSMSVDTSVISWNEFWGHILRRTVMFAIDYFLVTLFLGWPIRFIRGPVKWRRAIGFRDREVVVRQSRKPWSQKLVRNRWIYDDEKTVREKVVPAVSPERVKKSGFLLVDANWDLDYDAMVRAHRLIDLTRKGEGIQLDEFRTAVLVHTDDDGWLIWRVADEESKAKEQQRDKILAFRKKLASMGKEDLFFRWVEMIQFESTQPGGFTPERQRSAMLKAKEMFEAENVDFSRFWQEVGGMEGDIHLT